jgi:hypothetical protein
MNCYPQAYLEKYEVIEKSWSDGHFPKAKLTRNQEARRLRKEGYEVECRKYNCDGVFVYTLDARKERA